MAQCKLCGRKIEVPGRHRMFCPICAAYNKRMNKQACDKRRYERQRAEQGYKLAIILEYDPSKYPLEQGMTISAEEHKWMIQYRTYTPGTIIQQGETRKRIDLLNGKMVEVRI